MTTALKISQKSDLKISEMTDIEQLRKYYYSNDLNDTFEAISALKKINTSDASRELINIYSESVWRKVKTEALSALSNHNNQRSLEFLIRLSQSDEDLSMAHLSIEALGHIDNILSGRSLEQLYLYGHKSKKPALVLALVKLTYLPALKYFKNDLLIALQNKEYSLAKNLIYALGELRSPNDLVFLKSVVNGPYPKDIQLSSVSSIAKISRDPLDLFKYADQFKNDAFEFQIFQQSYQQLMFRSQWKIEDYLNRLFNSESFHKNLPLELNSFSTDDVISGLDLFFEEKYIDRMIYTLGFLSFDEIYSLFERCVEYGSKNENLLHSLQASILRHQSQLLVPCIEKIKNLDLQIGLRLTAFSSPDAHESLKKHMISEFFSKSNDHEKISFINIYSDFLSCFLQGNKNLTTASLFIENQIQSENSFAVKNRLIRILGSSNIVNTKIFNVFKHKSLGDEFTNSILYFIEKSPSYQGLMYLKDNIKVLLETNPFRFLKAYMAQDINDLDHPEIIKFTPVELKTQTSVDLTILCLKYTSLAHEKLSSIQKKEIYPLIVNLTKKPQQSLVLNAIICLKYINYDDTADVLAPLLNSKNESIKGRTLDALLFQNTVRSFRLSLDYIKANLDQIDFVEKTIRHFKQPNSLQLLKADYFLKTIQEMISHKSAMNPIIVELESLVQNERIESHLKNQIPSGADLIAIDQEILKNLKKYHEYDESVKASLRSAEVPFNKPELFDRYVDKSVCILGYTKAIDIFLEKHFGQKIILNKLESRLHEFQNAIHNFRLNEDHPDSQFVLKSLDLEKYFSAQSLPVHKMTLIGKAILNGKILNDHFKILDGLRAWAVMMLIFSKKNGVTSKSLIPLNLEEVQIVDLAKKLMWLQDLRNPVAHRHTLTALEEIKEIRTECFKILSQLEKTFL